MNLVRDRFSHIEAKSKKITIDDFSLLEQLRGIEKLRSTDRFLVHQPSTPVELIREITSKIRLKSTSRIGVIFTIEWALYLKSIGFKNITVLTEDYDQLIQKICIVNEFKYILISEAINKNMKFNVIAGNPPFSERSDLTNKSRDLDSLFLEKSMTLADDVHFIIRSKHLTNDKSNFRKKLFSSGRLTQVSYVPEKYFTQIINTETCVVSCQKEKSPSVDILYKNGIVKTKSLNQNDIILFSDPDYSGPPENNMAYRWIRGKLNRNQIVDDKNGINLVEIIGDNGKPIIRKVNGQLESTGYLQHGVIMHVCAEWGGLGKLAIKPYRSAISGSIVCITTSSLEESEKMMEYLQSKKVKDIVAKNMASFHPTKSLFSNIPDID